MIQERQRTEKVQRHDLFSNLLEANDHAFDVNTLSEDELIGLWAQNISFFSFIKLYCRQYVHLLRCRS
jgi:hypothetical protein